MNSSHGTSTFKPHPRRRQVRSVVAEVWTKQRGGGGVGGRGNGVVRRVVGVDRGSLSDSDQYGYEEEEEESEEVGDDDDEDKDEEDEDEEDIYGYVESKVEEQENVDIQNDYDEVDDYTDEEEVSDGAAKDEHDTASRGSIVSHFLDVISVFPLNIIDVTYKLTYILYTQVVHAPPRTHLFRIRNACQVIPRNPSHSRNVQGLYLEGSTSR